ncbi:triacylglycerol lipase (secreted protein) [Ophiostoma piceae UAMH 11346]|uniref:Carboxylic ester hydrolase n=1 Tax=Ophiostoma piceae (strain UAMH 11346) TaxID=1262450 RepID=S3BZG8_OPHP1|nr:triacylglycerol lipase (secreted protein) [Ophiostoma piceae UAMH 11346]
MASASDAVHGDGHLEPSSSAKDQAKHHSLAAYWKSRSATARCILVSAAVAAVALIAVSIAVGVVFGRRNSSSGSSSGTNATSVPLTVNLGYASYTGTRLSVQPPGIGSNRNTSADSEADSISVTRFLGMRYAAPPLGSLRWRAPAAPLTTSQAQPAQAVGPHCLGMGPKIPASQSEDCLFVNVWAPTNISVSKPKAVWVFIQGGGYTSNSNPDFDGADVVARSGGELVFVNFNYRVGLYGFLAGAQVVADGDLNVGLLDQRALLQWVRTHIAQFGGDPGRVVLHGGSAGAGSAVLQSIAYGGRNDSLFVGLVAESVFLPTNPLCSTLEYKFVRAVNGTSCASSTSSQPDLDCLRGLSTKELQVVNTPSSLKNATDTPSFYWGPCVDGEFLQDRPYTMFQDGRFVRVPMVFGTATNEGSIFTPNAESLDDAATFMINNYPSLGSLAESGPNTTASSTTAAASVLAEYYPVADAQFTSASMRSTWFPSLSAAYGELTFICGQVLLLQMVSSLSLLPAFAYRFNMQDPGDVANGLGTVHMMDGAAIFGPDNVDCCPPASYYGADIQGNPGLVPVMMDYYISFVLTLDPNAMRFSGSAAMDEWTSTAKSRLVITTGSNQAMETVPVDQDARCRAWLDLVDLTEQ